MEDTVVTNFGLFVDGLASLVPIVAPAAVLIALIINLAKSAGWVVSPESGGFLTAPRLNLILNGLVFVGLLVARIGGVEGKALELISVTTQLLPLVLTFVGALGLSALTHGAVLKPAGLAASASE